MIVNAPPPAPVEITVENVEEVLQKHSSRDNPCHPPDFGISAGKTDFNEGMRSEKLHPLANETNSFPMEATIRRLDGEPDPHELEDSTVISPAEVIRRLIEFMTEVQANDPRALSPIATRTLAAAWVSPLYLPLTPPRCPIKLKNQKLCRVQ